MNITVSTGQLVAILSLILLVIVLLSAVVAYVRWRFDRRYPDPVRRCKVYRRVGCSHVDGMLCDPATCREKLATDMWELGQQLDIHICDRLPEQLVKELEKWKKDIRVKARRCGKGLIVYDTNK